MSSPTGWPCSCPASNGAARPPCSPRRWPATRAGDGEGEALGGRLHGLNATRAWCWRQIAAALPPGDPRAEPAVAAARQHAKAVLPYVVGGDYRLEHWLAGYAVLMLS